MHVLGIGDSIQVSGHDATVTDIKSINNLDTGGRIPVVFATLNGTNRIVSILGTDIENQLDTMV